MKKYIIIVFIGVSVAFFIQKNRPIIYGSGQMASAIPLQTVTEKQPFKFKEFTIIPKANFELTARILHKKSYNSDPESKLAPWDIAFGWGPMSDESILKDVEIKQSNRFYFWRVEKFPILRRDIERNSANMHLIPQDSYLEDLIASTKVGNIIHLKGWLIRAESKDGNWYWQSSMTREDTGNGACELIFITHFEIIKP